MSKENGQLSADLEGEGLDGLEMGQIQAEVALNNPEDLKETQLGETEDFATRVARTCHEVNRAYCEGHGDFSQVPWDEAPRWVHESAMQGVKFFHENPNSKESAMHDSWCAQKLEDGWEYGEDKDPIKKTHPCLVSYRALPYKQRVKDTLFLSVVKSFVTLD